MMNRRALLQAVLLLPVVTLGGCGSSDGDPEPDPQPTQADRRLVLIGGVVGTRVTSGGNSRTVNTP